MDANCIFCKIIAKEIPADIITENDNLIVIKDIAPKAPIHYLIIPKKHISDIGKLDASERELAADLVMMAQQLSTKDASTQAFKLVSNNGAAIGQEVPHIHIHFLSGKKVLF